MTGLYILHENIMISLFQVYLHTEHRASPVAVVQTLTYLPSTQTCFHTVGEDLLLNIAIYYG